MTPKVANRFHMDLYVNFYWNFPFSTATEEPSTKQVDMCFKFLNVLGNKFNSSLSKEALSKW